MSSITRARTAASLLAALGFAAACSSSGAPAAPSEPTSPTPITASSPIPPRGTPQAPTASVGAFPDPSGYTWVDIVDGLVRPVDIQFPDDGSGRMFVVEQSGRIRIVEDGQLTPSPYLDISDKVGSAGNEQGLLGLAFHPDFRSHPYFYVNYTDLAGNTVISRFQGNADTADAPSEKVLLQVPQPFPNHNGGEVVFGPDGYLYIGLGDGGSAGDPYGNGQNLNVLLGKILRIDVDHGDPYGIPPSNPYAAGGGRPEIWAYGLRNPWRFSFARGTHDLYIGDVGQDEWEEVDVAPDDAGGLDYGWNYYEASHPYSAQPPPVTLDLAMPVTEYDHGQGRCAVIGGFVYAGQMAEWKGVYFYGDECSGQVWGMRNTSSPPSSRGWTTTVLFHKPVGISTFGQDPAGELYMAGLTGSVFQLRKHP